MKIVFAHFHPLPVAKYGGTERIIYWLMKALVRLGHDVFLIGHKKSCVNKIGVNLLPIEDKAWQKYIPKDADIIHFHTNAKVELDIPQIFTVHGNGQPHEQFHFNSVFVSKKHAKNHSSNCFVHNAIDLDEYKWNERKSYSWSDFLFLAKASWKVKNLKQCILSCKKAKKKLWIAGGKYYWPSKYIKGLGLINDKTKNELLNHCDALLFPVRWEEPFGVAMIEAMAKGLPVIGSCYGSLPEIINEEVGVTCNNFEHFKEAICTRPKKFTAKEIRNYVEKNFSIMRLAKDYLIQYEKVVSGEKLNLKKPTWSHNNRPEDLLAF